MWYTQMVSYDVYVPLLLRLANDVEENPGPINIYDIVDHSFTVRADFNQGNISMFGINAGKQCVAMSIYAIVYNEIKSVNIWDTPLMNMLLVNANNLYAIISQHIQKDFLLLTDVPEILSINNDTFNLEYSDSFSGALWMEYNNEPYVTLEHAFHEVFDAGNYKACLLTIRANTVAVLMPFPDVFKVFDSHSRDMHGMPAAMGYSVLVSIEGIQNLIHFFHNTNSCKGVKCHRNISLSNSLDNTENDTTSNNHEQQRKQQETVVERENRLEKLREKQREKRQQESVVEWENRLAKQRERRKQAKQQETVSERENRLAKRGEKRKQTKQQETITERENRLAKRGEKRKQAKQQESITERENRLAKRGEKRKQAKQQETITERENRLAKRGEKRKQAKQQETITERENRLAKLRQKRKQAKQQETVSERENRLQNQRKARRLKRQNETVEQREQRLAKVRANYKENKSRHSTKNKQSPPSGCQGPNNDNNISHNSVSQLIHKFHKSVSTGPLYICSCCDQLSYKPSVCPAERLRLSNPNSTKHLQGIKSVDNIEWLCLTCDKHLKKGKVPPSAITNGMKFPTKPDFFDLNELECRLIAPRLAFQKIMQAPRGRQLKITGNVVNVPADICNTFNMLPRLPQDTGTIKVQLKRRLQYKSSALSLNVRPNKVMQAAAWLVNTSELYQEQGITFDQHWLSYFDVTTPNSDNENITVVDQTNLTSEDEWSEDEAEIPAGVTDSMLTPTDFVDDTERQHIYNVAPGEGSRPLSIFRDQYSEELAYPGIFLGQKRPDEKHRLTRVHYSEICKSELRRSDRRAAMCIENIFFKTKKMQMKLLLGQSQLAIRKCKMGNRTLTAGELKTPEGLTNLICHDEGYKFLRALRGSPPYFEKAKKDLFAMIRQLGPASLFCSFSSAETKWNHLLRILGKLVDHKDYSDEQLDNLNWDEKCRLIQSDPVTCARHFDYQFNTFLKDFLMSEIAPLGKLKDWFYRVEYQQRGSPHIHMLIWLENAPVFGVDKDEDVVNFIDQIITCRKPDNNDTELFDLVNRQTHGHSHTCRKNSKKVL
ncbi:ATP-dependent DNA helicase PIF1 [Paramuricea clavata]|uniref:ATP-dependent DNA helicase PIF1 n=1 Tax=Paramuricea clavata TaxID=317549 RepID=A0A7D9IDW8_PARCT|nr:ATP-dependent DNA helicase PIF1 [Paramuricea clavata]